MTATSRVQVKYILRFDSCSSLRYPDYVPDEDSVENLIRDREDPRY